MKKSESLLHFHNSVKNKSYDSHKIFAVNYILNNIHNEGDNKDIHNDKKIKAY